MSTPNTVGITYGRTRKAYGKLSVADVGTIDTPGSAVLLYTASLPTAETKSAGNRGAAEGATLVDIEATSTAQPAAANVLRLYLYDGTNYYLFREIPITVPGVAQSATTVGWSLTVTALNRWIPPGWSVYATLGGVAAIVVEGNVGEF